MLLTPTCRRGEVFSCSQNQIRLILDFMKIIYHRSCSISKSTASDSTWKNENQNRVLPLYIKNALGSPSGRARDASLVLYLMKHLSSLNQGVVTKQKLIKSIIFNKSSESFLLFDASRFFHC